MRRRRGRRGRRDCVPALAIAFGAGLLLAMFFSFRLALVVAAITIIYIGICWNSC